MLLAVAKANNLDIEVVETNPPNIGITPEYLKLNPLGKIPTFEGANGFVLTECIAIAIYCKLTPRAPWMRCVLRDELYYYHSVIPV